MSPTQYARRLQKAYKQLRREQWEQAALAFALFVVDCQEVHHGEINRLRRRLVETERRLANVLRAAETQRRLPATSPLSLEN